MVYLFTGLNSGNNRVAARNVFDHQRKYTTQIYDLEATKRRIDSKLRLYDFFIVDCPEYDKHPIEQIEFVKQFAEIQKERPRINFIITTVSNYIIEAFEIYFKDNIEFYFVDGKNANKIDPSNIDIIYKTFAEAIQILENDRCGDND